MSKGREWQAAAALLRQEIDSLEKQTALRFQAADIALDKRDTAMDFRLSGMNEWRSTMTDLTGTFITRAQQDANDTRLRLLENFRANIQGRMAMVAGGSILLNMVITVVAIVLAQGR